MKIVFTNSIADASRTVVFFIGEQKMMPKALQNAAYADMVRQFLAADRTFHGKLGQTLHCFCSSGSGTMVVLVGTGKGDPKHEWQSLGAAVTVALNHLKVDKADVYVEFAEDVHAEVTHELAARIAFSIESRNYVFDKYYSSSDKALSLKEVNVVVPGGSVRDIEGAHQRFAAVISGLNLTRDLVSEPGNVLYPESFAQRCLELEADGVIVTTYMPEQLKKLGMNALLGVAQGSEKPARLVVLEWRGSDDPKAECVALVGKGVTFDTGGIDIKPSKNMSDMKYDMAGAAVVAGTIRALARRKAKANVIGVLGLVENMPSGNAQRPGDVVKSMSGITIEVDNTDAEGRLVLADAMWFTQEKYKPSVMIDLATLTGAVVVALGELNAGLFSNDNDLAAHLIESGKATNSHLWRLPMGEGYDKQINSEIADVRNTGTGRGGGSTTAAQFLYRFVQKDSGCRWAHLDIAGVAWNKGAHETLPKGATGFGVTLLDEFIHRYYEV